MGESKDTPVATRDPSTGQFVKGVSGNPAGRPVSTKNQLTNVKQEMELAIRKNMSPQKISAIVETMYELALEGSVGAAKLLLDKTVSNAKTEEDNTDGPGSVTIRIENMTLPQKVETTVIDVTPATEEDS